MFLSNLSRRLAPQSAMVGLADKGDHKCGFEGEPTPKAQRCGPPETVFKRSNHMLGLHLEPHPFPLHKQGSVIPKGFPEATEASCILFKLQFPVQLKPLIYRQI